MRSFILIFIFAIPCISYAQRPVDKAQMYLDDKGEVYLSFDISSTEELCDITKLMTIDQVNDLNVKAFASQKEFDNFIKLQIAFKVLPRPGDLLEEAMMYDGSEKSTFSFNTYPTYNAYLNIMNGFETNHPALSEVVDIGNSVQNRELLFVKISDNVAASENEPQFMYTSTMHGDETAGYVLMLRLIDYLLVNYNTDDRVREIVDNLEVHINPVANPDGTYAGGNNTVLGATRYNANFVDLNRNFPDPQDGQNPDGNVHQAETLAFMNYADQNNFVLSANFHGGVEVVNYPWDTWGQTHPQEPWLIQISRRYASLAQQNSPNGYMNAFNNGVTNGYDWYEVDGGRQDYMTHFHKCMEVTVELSDIKLLPENQLQDNWDYNKESLLTYMEEVYTMLCFDNFIRHVNIIGETDEQLAKIQVSAQNEITSGSDVHYGALDNVLLLPGFEVSADSDFLADLNGCN